MNVQFKPVVAEVLQRGWPALVFKILPHWKGDWLLYCPFLSLFCREKRKARLSISIDGEDLFTTDFDIADPPQYSMLKERRYDLASALTIWFLLKEGDVFIDVGANHGYLSSVAAQKVGESGLVISFEPGFDAFRQLTRREPNIFALNLAVSDTAGGHLSLKRPFYRQSTSGFCVKGNKIAKTSLDFIYDKFKKPHVSLIKIDTEGMELPILRGGTKILSERKPYVIVELEERYARRYGYTVSDVFGLMSELGYQTFYSIDNAEACLTSCEAPKEGDILFSTKELTTKSISL